MRVLAIVLALLPITTEASELYAFYFCGRPAMYVGVIGPNTLPATALDIHQNSATANFFARVARELPIVDGKPVVYKFHIDRLLDYDCGVSA